MCKVIAVSNQKGGVGKTVSCVNLGIGLAQEGKKVLLIDGDPQGSLTISLGYEEPDEMEYSLATLMMNIVNDEKLNIEKTILHHKEGVDLIPANIELSAIEVSLVNAMSRELILRSMVEKLRDFYDFIIIDCMPSLGMMTINALACADSVLILVQAAYLPVKGLQQLIKTIGRVKKQLNPKLKIEGILLTMVDNRTNYAKVSDHHAIIPTVNVAEAEFGELPSGEQKVLSLITARLLAALGDAAVRNEVDVEFTCADTVFRTKTKNIREKGWREIQDWIIGSKADSTDSEEENEDKRGNAEMLACIAAMTNGRSYPLQNPKMEEGKTTPKKHFTEDSLLSAMECAGADEMPDEAERKGIGTSATRAATIEKLVRIGFVERKGNKKTKYLMPTHKGVALITVMPEQIQSPSMTAEWEQKLLDVEKGNFQDTEFMSEIENMITDLVKTYKVIEDAEVLMHPAMEEIGICPCCGQHVVERQKGYSCENRGCKFVLWKQNRFFEALGKKMTKQTAIKLLRDGKVALKGCKSKKTGNIYDTTVVMTVDENQRAVFELNFEKGEAKYGKGKGKKN